ncbi:MAG: ATP-binding cassette domain-containing protein [Clostridiales bacterium]|nr:ATP-binding cassette domain-containing protein [Clostridiales bacterium]
MTSPFGASIPIRRNGIVQNTKKLLSITNLKKYFPVAKSSIFQKNKLYVRANEDITIDIYEGETLGVVGESGCGKSTLGRVLLQLYPQTAGCTLYYGVTLDELTPSYVRDTLRKEKKYRAKLAKASAKARDLEKKVEAAGGEDGADFYLLQECNIAQCDEQTHLSNITKILGGFFVKDDPQGISLLTSIYQENKKCNRLLSLRKKHQVNYDHFSHEVENGDARQKASMTRKRDQEQAALAHIDSQVSELREKIAGLQNDLDAVKAKYKDDPDFAKYEAMLDNGVDLARLTVSEMRDLRKNLQIIFQDPYSSLNPRFTVGQIIEEGLVTHHFFKHGSAKMRAYIVDTMEKCGLQEYMLHRYPHQFSGGQRQRICIARALAVQPKFVVCDECVSALDVSIQSQIINLLQDLKEKQHLTYMFISHDLSVVKFISDRIAVMYLGSIVELADKNTIFNDPRHPYTVALLSSIPTTDPDSADKERIILEGNIPSPVNPPAGCKFCTRCYMATEKCHRVTPPLVEIEPNHFCACHYPERKIDENKNYLFDVKTTKTEA